MFSSIMHVKDTHMCTQLYSVQKHQTYTHSKHEPCFDTFCSRMVKMRSALFDIAKQDNLEFLFCPFNIHAVCGLGFREKDSAYSHFLSPFFCQTAKWKAHCLTLFQTKIWVPLLPAQDCTGKLALLQQYKKNWSRQCLIRFLKTQHCIFTCIALALINAVPLKTQTPLWSGWFLHSKECLHYRGSTVFLFWKMSIHQEPKD